jgi:hypothetical protein
VTCAAVTVVLPPVVVVLTAEVVVDFAEVAADDCLAGAVVPDAPDFEVPQAAKLIRQSAPNNAPPTLFVRIPVPLCLMWFG